MSSISPKIRSLNEILPETLPLLMGSGPVPIPKEVADANRIVINHLGDSMNKVVTGIVEMGQYIFQTKTNKIFGIAGPSSAAMEMAVSSLLWKGRKVLVLNLGVFSARFTELSRGVDADVTELFPEPLSPFTPDQVRSAFLQSKYDVLALVHGETSCGIKNAFLPEILNVAREYGVITIVDAVVSLSLMPMQMDEWGADVVFTGGQKGFSSVAGTSIIAFSDRAFEIAMKREVIMPHWCLDPRRAYKFWVKHEYHYTAPVNGLLAMYEAMRLICDETLPKRFERHLNSSQSLQQGLEQFGFEMYAPEYCRLNSVVAIKNRNGVNIKEMISYVKSAYNIEISSAFGLDIFRVGQMGEQARAENVRRVLEAIAGSYQYLGVNLNQTEETLFSSNTTY